MAPPDAATTVETPSGFGLSSLYFPLKPPLVVINPEPPPVPPYPASASSLNLVLRSDKIYLIPSLNFFRDSDEKD